MKIDILKEFNLPSYLKGKTFSEASKSINDKFKGRNDKISMDTKNELLGRLAQAQEKLKQELEIEQPSEDMFFGGDVPTEAGGVNPMGVASTSFGLADPFIKEGTGKSAVKGALQGASAGAMLGPIGAGVGAVVGGVSSALSSEKQKEEEQKMLNTASQKNNSMYSSDFGYGGKKKYAVGGNLDDIFKVMNPLEPNTDLPAEDAKVAMANTPDIKTKLGKRLEFLKDKGSKLVKDNYADVLRYAPVVANAKQLADLDKPQYERLDRLDNRYEKDLADEAALTNQVEQEAANTRRALTNASTGSAGALRSNLLGLNLSSSKALSDTMLQADNINRNENRSAQQFNLNVDQTNLRQANLENDINARNQGVYESNKSALISQLGDDIGNIGKEEKYKQMIEDLGLCYDINGAYICGTEERVPDNVASAHKESQQKAMGGSVKTNSLFDDYFNVLKKRRKNG